MGFWQVKGFPLIETMGRTEPGEVSSTLTGRRVHDRGEIQTERDEGVPGGGKAFPIDVRMLDSRPPAPISPELERMLEEQAMKRARRDQMLRTFHRTPEQAVGLPGTFQGDEEEDENG